MKNYSCEKNLIFLATSMVIRLYTNHFQFKSVY